MARVTYVDPQNAPEETARALQRLPTANVFGLVAQARTAFVPWLRLGGALLNDLSLPASLRELAILQVGRLAQRYEWDQHVPIAVAAGITETQIAALEGGDDTTPFDDVQRAVLSFVADMVRDGDVSDADYAALSGLLDEQQIVEVALVAAHYLGLARLMTALRIDPDEPMGPGALRATTT
ncbi:carboxymuconolactone decarboxylase family protein [Pseudonocardia endophytica]|uniref:Alkylhydroperoxidase family enzyme n=1 Tax=Pseudonocardia endophytica TaxID=401976 RepID=A0A4R1HYU1_PSEEN|nr:carboxymuconolactone decarboxylase family protein [Pseudonocardia endophytica]TCK26050.1 alkylhydroperoxidase family enzyme [Pseudonocardia endophytica]